VPGCRGDVSDLNKNGGRGLAVPNENGVDTYSRIVICTGRSICEDVRFTPSLTNRPKLLTRRSQRWCSANGHHPCSPKVLVNLYGVLKGFRWGRPQ